MNKLYSLRGLVKGIVVGAMGLGSVILSTSEVQAQCNNTIQYASATAPTSGTVNFSTCQYYGEYSPINSVAAATVYTNTISGGGYVTIRIGSPSGTIVSHGASPHTWASTTAGTYYAHWSTSSTDCSYISGCLTTSITYVGPSSACTNPVNAGSVNGPSLACNNETITLSLTGASTGTGMTYQWQSSPNGSTWTNISGATGSSANVTITAPTYYRCVVQCSSGTPANTSAFFVGLNSFWACYCNAGATSTTYGYIEQFDFSNVSFTSPTGCGQSYTDNTALTANVFQGQTYNLEAYINSCTGTYPYNTGFKVWIDFNKDADFNDPGEEVISQNLTYFQTHGGNISIPLTSDTGVTGLRVMMVESGSLSAMNPCYSFTWGEVEDYTVNIIAPPTNDVGIAQVASPAFPACELDSNICIVLENSGTDTLTSATISYSVNGGTYTNYSWTGSIPPFTSDSVCVQVGVVNFVAGDDLEIAVSNPNGSSGSYTANDSTEIINMSVSLQGTYGIPGDFATIGDAIDSMNSVGVCDHVIIELATGTYTDSIVLGPVVGMGPSATVTWTSATGDSTDVVISHEGTSTENYTVYMNGASWFRFDNLTIENSGVSSYRRVFVVEGGSANNKVRNSVVRNVQASSTSDLYALVYSAGSNDNNWEFSNNRFEEGSFGFRWVGAGTTVYETGTRIWNNEFVNQYYYGLYLENHEGIQVKGNSIHSNSTYTGTSYGIECDDCDFGYQIDGNHVYTETGDIFPRYGLYLDFSEGSGANPGYVRNNIISIGSDAGASYTYYGVYQYYTDIVYVTNNTFTIMNGGTSSRAYYPYYSDFFFTENNVISNFGAGYAGYFYYGLPFTVERNNYYSNGAYPMYYNTANHGTLQSFVDASGLDTTSLAVNPSFSDTINGYLCNDSLDGIGRNISYMTNDFYGETRIMNEIDLGAVEFFDPSMYSLVGDTICSDEYEVTFDGPVSTANWSVNSVTSTGPSVTLSASGTAAQSFNVLVAFSSVCGSGSGNAVFRLVPPATLASNEHICADETITLTPGGGTGAQYEWFPGGQTTANIAVSEAGSYSVTKVEDGCESQATTIVTKSQAVQVVDQEICDEDLPLEVDASIADGTAYAWSGGTDPNSAVNTFDQSGSYAVTATDAFGCTSIDSFELDVIDVPIPAITHSHTGNYYFFSSDNTQNAGSNASYAWDFGDGSAGSTLANPQHQFPWSNPSSPATYTVTLLVVNDCGSNSISVQVTPDVLGVSELGNDLNVNIYPNPSNGVFNFAVNGIMEENISIRVLDVTGRVVASEVLTNEGVSVLNLSHLAKGSYMVEMNDGTHQSNTQILIQ